MAGVRPAVLDSAMRLGVSAAVVATVAIVGISLVVWGGRGFPELPMSFVRGPLGVIELALLALVYTLVGAFMVGRVPRFLVGGSLVLIGIGVALHLPANLLVDQARAAFQPVAPPLLLFVWALSSLVVPMASALIALLVMVLPDGRLPSRRWRLVVVSTVTGLILLALGSALTPSGLIWFPTLPNPLPIPSSMGSVATVGRVAGVGLLALGLLLAALCLVGRYWAGDRELRLQLRWVLAGCLLWAIALAALLLSRYLLPVTDAYGTAFVHVAAFASLAVPIAILLATIRYHLFGAEVFVSRTLVYLPLMAICAGVYAAGVALSQRLFVEATGNTSDVAIVLATLLAAGAFMPVRRWLETMVDRHVTTGSVAQPSGARVDVGVEQAALAEQAAVLTARLADIERRLAEIRSTAPLDRGAEVGEPGVGGSGWPAGRRARSVGD
jgi:hypothetical protein